METIRDFAFIINFALLIVTYWFAQSFKIKIENLTEAIKSNTESNHKLQDIINEQRVHIGKLEESLESAHKRITEMSDRVKDLEHRCVNCQCRG